MWLEPKEGEGKGQAMLGLAGQVKDFDLYTRSSVKSLKAFSRDVHVYLCVTQRF